MIDTVGRGFVLGDSFGILRTLYRTERGSAGSYTVVGISNSENLPSILASTIGSGASTTPAGLPRRGPRSALGSVQLPPPPDPQVLRFLGERSAIMQLLPHRKSSTRICSPKKRFWSSERRGARTTMQVLAGIIDCAFENSENGPRWSWTHGQTYSNFRRRKTKNSPLR